MTRTVAHIVRKTIEDLERTANPPEDDAALNEIKSNLLLAISELELSKEPRPRPEHSPSASQEESTCHESSSELRTSGLSDPLKSGR